MNTPSPIDPTPAPDPSPGNPAEALLDATLADLAPPGFRRELLAQTLRHARGRRRSQSTRRIFSFAVPAAAAAGLAIALIPGPPPDPDPGSNGAGQTLTGAGAPPKTTPFFAVRSSPASFPCVRTNPGAIIPVKTTAVGSNFVRRRTGKVDSGLRFLTDEQLLALFPDQRPMLVDTPGGTALLLAGTDGAGAGDG